MDKLSLHGSQWVGKTSQLNNEDSDAGYFLKLMFNILKVEFFKTNYPFCLKV